MSMVVDRPVVTVEPRRPRAVRAVGSEAQPEHARHLGGAVPGAVGGDVRGVPGVVLVGAAARSAGGRLPGAHLHHVPRLRARFAAVEQARQRVGSAPRSDCSSSRRSRAGATST